ncbi:MAG: hypothetical protein CMG35_01435 [Candidatus Marinimicrobia bacterium]|nr:hypothetical protein [Candidatus Neomarinimicrobiota bacterium]
MTLTLGQETGRIAPGNLGQQLNLSVNWNQSAQLVCNSHIDVTGQQLTSSVGSVTIDAQQVQQVTGFENTLSSQPAVVNYTVTVVNYGSGNVFVLNGSANPAISMFRATKYVFDQSDGTNGNHPLRFKDASGASYTDGVVVTGTPGQAGAKVEFTVPAGAPNSLRYYCSVHGNAMGNTITVNNYITISGVAIANTTGQQLTLGSTSFEPVIAKIFTATGNQIALSQGSVEITINQSRLVDGFLLNANTADVSIFSGWDDVTVPDVGNWTNIDPGFGSTWSNINATTSGSWTEVSTPTSATWTKVTVPTDGSNWTE